MADALAAGQHGIHELLGFQLVAVALAADLEPLHRVPSGVLQAQGLHAAQRLVGVEHLAQLFRGVAQQLELAHQLDGIFESQLGARSDGEVRGVHCIAHQHHMAAVPVFQPPLVAHHALEVQPCGAAQVARVGHQLLALQVLRKKRFAEVDALLLVGSVQTVCQPHMFGTFDDEGGGLVVELVDVGLEPAMLGLSEIEGEGIVELVGSQPDVAIGTHHDVGLEHVLVLRAHLGVDPVAGDDEVGVGVVLVGIRVLLEHQLHVQLLATRLQNVEQLLPADAHEAVAARSDGSALEQKLDIVPVIEGLLDLIGRHVVPLAHVVHGGIGEHDAPAEGVIRLVALDHGDVMGRIELLHQQAEIQAGGAAADADDLHGHSSCEYFSQK